MKRVEIFSVFTDWCVSLPKDAEILKVGVGPPAFPEYRMWIFLDTEAPKVERWFHVMFTGEEIDPSWAHRGSWQKDNTVWHLFEDVDAMGDKPK